MRYLLILILSGCASVGPQSDGSVIHHITAETVQACEQQGGCILVSERFLEEFARISVAQMCGKEI